MRFVMKPELEFAETSKQMCICPQANQTHTAVEPKPPLSPEIKQFPNVFVKGRRTMQLVEQHMIDKNHRFWGEIDTEAFLSKNLYNYANYIVRQHFFATDEIYTYESLYKLVKDSSDYKALPAKVAQQVLLTLAKNWKGYNQSLWAYRKDRSKFLGEPKKPHYKHKEDGRNILVYTIQAISQPLLRINQVKLSGLSFNAGAR